MLIMLFCVSMSKIRLVGWNPLGCKILCRCKIIILLPLQGEARSTTILITICLC